MNVNTVTRTVLDRVSRDGSYSSTDSVVLRTVRRLQALGDQALNGLNVVESYGRVTVSRRPQAVVCNNTGRTTPQRVTAPTKPAGSITRNVTSKGVTVPQAMLETAGISAGAGLVWLRPLNSTSFLVMRTRGTNQNTVRHGMYSDGRVVLSRTTLNSMLNGTIREGDSLTFSKNGNTQNTILVSVD